MPDFSIEQTHATRLSFGLDEVGRGPLVGPVTAACVYVPEDKRGLDFWADVKDSKKISKPKRAQLYDKIIEHCHCGIAEASIDEIATYNIIGASYLAMERAFRTCHQSLKLSDDSPIIALIDGKAPPSSFPCEYEMVIKGDNISSSIAAASILAKVSRDRLMKEYAENYPQYGWENNSGYPTKEHLDAIDVHGITEFHRPSYGPVQNFLQYGQTRRQLALGV